MNKDVHKEFSDLRRQKGLVRKFVIFSY